MALDPTNEAMDKLITALANRITEKAAGTTPTTNFAHGPGGIFAQPGQRANVVNAMTMPFGIRQELPYKRSLYANEVYPILTGQTAATGSNPSTACGDCKQPGNLKVCNQTWPFGRFCIDSQPMQVDRLGLQINRSEFVDQNLIGNPFAQTEALPGMTFDPVAAMRNEKGKQLLQLFVDFRRLFDPIVWTGNPTNNSGTGYAEYYGLQTVINTGYKDAYTGVVCPAADPRVIAFGNVDVATTPANIVNLMVELWNNRRYQAERVGLKDPEYAWVMRYAMFRKLTELWPITYYTYRQVNPTTGSTTYVDAKAQVDLRDSMRQGSYLLMDGERVKVIIDATLPETLPVAGTAQSDIFLIPLSHPAFSNPGGAITYFEYFDMTTPAQLAQEGFSAYPMNTFQAIGGGRFLVYPKAPSNVCIQYGMLSKDRLICEAPFLAGRITGCRYTFTLHENEWDAGSAYYFYDGGQYTFGSGQYFYPPQ